MNWFSRQRQLNPKVHEKITALSEQGDTLATNSDYPAALQKYWEAWDLLPKPKTTWQAATWILSAIGDANFLSGDFATGRDNLSMAMHCPAAVGNAFLHLRLGQCQYEMGNFDRAADELGRAYMAAGTEIFGHDDPKYFEFLTKRMKPPAGGW